MPIRLRPSCALAKPRLGLFQKRSAGFSYLELIATLMVLAILAAVAVPEAANALARQRMKAAAQRVVSAMNEAIQISKSTGESQEVLFATGSPLIFAPGMIDPKTRTRPRIIDLRELDPNLVVRAATFGDGDGLPVFQVYQQGRVATNGTVTLFAQGRLIPVTVKDGVLTVGAVQ